jgi:hypothetical protein
MGDAEHGKGVAVTIRPRHRSRGPCSCGWVGKPHLLLSSAKCDALIHAAQCECEPAVLVVECPAGCRATFSVPLEVTDTLSVGSEDGEPSVRFTAEAPEVHDHIYKHLKTCASARSWSTPRCTSRHEHGHAGSASCA